MAKLRIVYVGGFRFPNLDAAAKRVLGIGNVLRELGHEVVFAGGEQGTKILKLHEGFEYYSQGELDKKEAGIMNKLRGYLRSGNNTLQFLKDFHSKNAIDKIIIYNSTNVFVTKIKKFCDRNGIDSIVDITEWYDSRHLAGGRFGPLAIDNTMKMIFTYKKIKKHIVISTFLSNYYDKYVEKNIIVPPLLLKDPHFVRAIKVPKYKIVYIGSPGQKDDLSAILFCFEKNRAILENIEFEIVGITKEEFQQNYNQIIFSDSIRFLGRVSHAQVQAIYESAHFSFLLRDNVRYANAGFSTKLVESLSFGVPLIANVTSDIGKYLEDGKNAFIVEHKPYSNLLDVLTRINSLLPEEVNQMMLNAYQKSLEFQYKNYLASFKQFLS